MQSNKTNPTSRFMRGALRHRNYRLFFAGQGLSLVGTWMQRIAVAWLVYRLTGSVFLLGFVGFAGRFPRLSLLLSREYLLTGQAVTESC